MANPFYTICFYKFSCGVLIGFGKKILTDMAFSLASY